ALRAATRARGGGARSAAATERLALGDEPANARELVQEATALAGVVLGGLTVLLGVVADEVAQPHLAGSQPLREAEDVTKADRRRQRGTERAVLALLDPLGDCDLAL